MSERRLYVHVYVGRTANGQRLYVCACKGTLDTEYPRVYTDPLSADLQVGEGEQGDGNRLSSH